jgi:putative acetyltransferase
VHKPTTDETHVEIRRSEINSATATTLIAALNAELSKQYPEEGATHFRLDSEEVVEGNGAFLIAYAEGEPIGCGAIRRLDPEMAEIKRMFVVPKARGLGISKKILLALEAEGQRLGVRKLLLETGERQIEAMALYRRAGFIRIPLFGEYLNSPLSVCMAKEI